MRVSSFKLHNRPSNAKNAPKNSASSKHSEKPSDKKSASEGSDKNGKTKAGKPKDKTSKKSKSEKKSDSDRVKRLERSLRDNLAKAEQTENQEKVKAEAKANEAESKKSEAKSLQSRAELQAARSESELEQAKAQVERLKQSAETSSTQQAFDLLTQGETELARAGVTRAETAKEKAGADQKLNGALSFGAKAKGQGAVAEAAKKSSQNARQMLQKSSEKASKQEVSKLLGKAAKLDSSRQNPAFSGQSWMAKLREQTKQRQEKTSKSNAEWIKGALHGPPVTQTAPQQPVPVRPGQQTQGSSLSGRPELSRPQFAGGPQSPRPGQRPGISLNSNGSRQPHQGRTSNSRLQSGHRDGHRPFGQTVARHGGSASGDKGSHRTSSLQPPFSAAGQKNEAKAEAEMHRAKELRSQGDFEKAKDAEQRARTALFRSELNRITAQGAKQRLAVARIDSPNAVPSAASVQARNRAVLDQFANLGANFSTPATISLGANATSGDVEREVSRPYDAPPKRWEDPGWTPEQDSKRKK